MTTIVIVFILGVVFSAFFSGTETGIYALNRLRLELRAASPVDRAARALSKLIASHEALLCILLVGNNIANEATTILAERIVSQVVPDATISTLVTAAVLTPFLFIFGEALPKQLFRLHAETWVYRITPLLQVFRIILAPLWLLVLPVARLANRWASGKRASGFRHDEFALERLLSSAGRKVDPVRETALTIGTRHRIPARDVMIPVDRVQTLDFGATIDDLRGLLSGARHSRYPIRDEDGVCRNYVYFLDAFTRSGDTTSLKRVARPLAILDPDSPLDAALDILESDGSRVAVVKSASGATLGFLFAADVVFGLLSAESTDGPLVTDRPAG